VPVPALGIYMPRPKPEPGQPVEKARRTPGTAPRVEPVAAPGAGTGAGKATGASTPR
jgi:hypothetical protein